jgi:CheY-like chemotaxis protein
VQVLVIDDNRDGADMLEWLFEDNGHVVQFCYSAIQALEWNSPLRADVIFCGLGMP